MRALNDMPVAINDEFAALPISRQQKYQLRKVKLGLCPTCGKKPLDGRYACKEHTYGGKRAKPEKYQARKAVILALARGDLRREKCEKCNKLGQAHHEDYGKPLEVRWLCHAHHNEAHGIQSFNPREIKIQDLVRYHKEYGKKHRETYVRQK